MTKTPMILSSLVYLHTCFLYLASTFYIFSIKAKITLITTYICIKPKYGIYFTNHVLTTPFSSKFVSITIVLTFSCQTILQKSATVSSVNGPMESLTIIYRYVYQFMFWIVNVRNKASVRRVSVKYRHRQSYNFLIYTMGMVREFY